MPVALVLTKEGDDITVTYEHNGDPYGDRPSVNELLEQVGSA